MRVLVTGGAGFVGSCYVRSVLLGRWPALTGAEVVVLDRLSERGSVTNLGRAMRSSRLRFVQGDIRDTGIVRSLMCDVDAVVHLAGEDRPDAGWTAAVSTNVLGTEILLSAAAAAGVRRFVSVTTDAVYGAGDEVRAESDPLAPDTQVAATCAAGDLLATSYHRQYGLPVCVARSAGAYGPYQHPDAPLALAICTALENGRASIHGDSCQVREWLHVDDLCQGIQLIIESGCPGEVYNVGSGERAAPRDVTNRVLALLGAEAGRIGRVQPPVGGEASRCVDWSKLASTLGYRPQVPLGLGLVRTITWYLRNERWWKPLTRGMRTDASVVDDDIVDRSDPEPQGYRVGPADEE